MNYTKQTVLIANAKAQRMGGYTENREYTIKEFYGINDNSCIISDDLELDDHFYVINLEKFFTIK